MNTNIKAYYCSGMFYFWDNEVANWVNHAGEGIPVNCTEPRIPIFPLDPETPRGEFPKYALEPDPAPPPDKVWMYMYVRESGPVPSRCVEASTLCLDHRDGGGVAKYRRLDHGVLELVWQHGNEAKPARLTGPGPLQKDHREKHCRMCGEALGQDPQAVQLGFCSGTCYRASESTGPGPRLKPADVNWRRVYDGKKIPPLHLDFSEYRGYQDKDKPPVWHEISMNGIVRSWAPWEMGLQSEQSAAVYDDQGRLAEYRYIVAPYGDVVWVER